MQAIVFDPPVAMTFAPLLRDVAEPVAGPGRVLVRVHRAGLNFADLMMRQGVYPHPKGYPLVAGLELSGVVEACGEGVTGYAPGDRVAGFSEDAGGFAELCAVPEERLIRLPDAMSFDVGAAFYIQSLTAWHLLHTVSKTQAGDTLLIHAIGGGVGLQLAQLAKMTGAVVIGTVGTAGKEAKALAFGADHVVTRPGPQRDHLQEATCASTKGSINQRTDGDFLKFSHEFKFESAHGFTLAGTGDEMMKMTDFLNEDQ